MPSYEEKIDPISPIKNFNAFIRDATSRYEYNLETIKKREEDTQDILHEIEFGEDKDISDIYELYMRLKAIRQDRRQAKTENESLESLITWCKESGKNITSILGNIQGDCKKIIDRQKNRVYTPRGYASKLE